MLRGTIYVHNTECTIDLIDSNIGIDTIDIIECTLSWDCDDENDPYNSTLGGLIELSTASDIIPQNIDSVTLYRGSDIWLTGYFKTEEETFEIDDLGKEIVKYSFGCALSIAQDESIRKYMSDNDKGRFIQFDTLINDLVKGYNSQLLSDIQVNLNTPTLDQLKADCRAFYNDDSNNRDVLSELALTFNSRAFCFRNILYLQQGDKAANHFNSITVTEDNLQSGGLEYRSTPYIYDFDYSTITVDNLVLNNQFICGSNNGTSLYGYYSLPVSDSLKQAAAINDPVTYAKFISDAGLLVSENGTITLGTQTLGYSYELKSRDRPTGSQTYTIESRLCYYDDNKSHYALKSDGSWEFIGSAPASGGISDVFDSYSITDSKGFQESDTSLDDDTGLWIYSHNVEVSNISSQVTPPMNDQGSFYLLVRSNIIGTNLGKPNDFTLTNMSINIVGRVYRLNPINQEFNTFVDKDIKGVSRTLGADQSLYYGSDVQNLNGALLYNDQYATTSQAVLNEMNAYNKEGYKEISLYIDEYISPLNTIVYNGVNHFIQKINYNLSEGICNLTIKECK